MKELLSSKANEIDKLYIQSHSVLPARFLDQQKRNDVRHFSVFRRDEQPCNEAIHANRSDYYKILLVTKGEGEFDYGTKCYQVKANSLVFVKPSEVKVCRETTVEQDGYYCVFTQDFYAISTAFLKELKQSPLFAPGAYPVLRLNEEQVNIVLQIFKQLHEEFNNTETYSEEIIHSYLRILLMESLRIRGLKNTTGPGTARFQLTQKFKDLLEEQFADRLRVHPNHLNATLKQTTGKTIRELIKERTISEAQVLLRHTDKQVKVTGTTPLAFRNEVL